MSKPIIINTKDLPKTDLHETMEKVRNIARNPLSDINKEFKAMGTLNNIKAQREIESHEALLQIAENTQGIKDLVSLVRQGNEINQQTFELLQQLQTIMTAETEEEAESILREVISTANQANEDFETIQTMIGYGKMLINFIFASDI